MNTWIVSFSRQFHLETASNFPEATARRKVWQILRQRHRISALIKHLLRPGLSFCEGESPSNAEERESGATDAATVGL
jgi:hypothetical protein